MPTYPTNIKRTYINDLEQNVQKSFDYIKTQIGEHDGTIKDRFISMLSKAANTISKIQDIKRRNPLMFPIEEAKETIKATGEFGASKIIEPLGKVSARMGLIGTIPQFRQTFGVKAEETIGSNASIADITGGLGAVGRIAKITGRAAGEIATSKGVKNLTTKFLNYVEEKLAKDPNATLSRQEITDFARRPELKKGEADLLLKKLEEFGGADTLSQEARKFKSAEEFVKAQGKIEVGYDWKYLDEMKKAKKDGFSYSHSDYNYLSKIEKEFRGKGISEDFYRAGKIGEEGDIWLTPNKAGAEQYGKSGGTKIEQYKVATQKPLILREKSELEKIVGKLDNESNFTNNPDLKEKVINYAKKNGYDSVLMPDSFPDGYAGMESLVVWDKNLIKTKSQLTDIWNKAQGASKLPAQEFIDSIRKAEMGFVEGGWSKLQEQNPDLFNTGILRRSQAPYKAVGEIPEDIHKLQGKWQNYGQYDEVPAETIYGKPDNYGYYTDKNGNSITDINGNHIKDTNDYANNAETVKANISNQQFKDEFVKSFSTPEGKKYLNEVIKALPKNPDGSITAYRIGNIGGEGAQSYTLSEGMAKTFSNQGTDILPPGTPGLPKGGYKDFGVLPANVVKIDTKGIVAWSPYDAEILVEPKYVKPISSK